MPRGTKRLSPSVARGLSPVRKLQEGALLFRQYRHSARQGHDFASIFAEIEEYDALLRQHTGVALADAKVFEIGFGARPYRQLVLQSMGVDVRGVDAEVPVLSGRISEFYDMFRRNGIERAAKSLVRHAFFDRGEERALHAAIRARRLEPRLDPERLSVGDAGDVDLPAGSVDLVFSEDVFEHIERGTLERLVPKVARWLRPGGLALIRPNIFTGIVGGHLLEWSRAAMRNPSSSRKSAPWEHLRAQRFEPNTYLNKLTRADYRELLWGSFEIVEERVAHPDLGREHLDEATRAELTDWPDEELFSNQTLFVLRPLPR
jgi:SAM-dependent methyltransferase